MERAYRVSFERPFDHQAATPLWWEIQLVRFLEREGYDVSYATDIDTDRDPSSLLQHRLVIVAGHDEYWTLAIRDAFDARARRGNEPRVHGLERRVLEHAVRGRRPDDLHVQVDVRPESGRDDRRRRCSGRSAGRSACSIGVQHADIRALDHPLDYTVTSAGASDPWLQGTGFRPGDRIAGVVGREHDTLTGYPGLRPPR